MKSVPFEALNSRASSIIGSDPHKSAQNCNRKSSSPYAVVCVLCLCLFKIRGLHKIALMLWLACRLHNSAMLLVRSVNNLISHANHNLITLILMAKFLRCRTIRDVEMRLAYKFSVLSHQPAGQKRRRYTAHILRK